MTVKAQNMEMHHSNHILSDQNFQWH